jgi:GNAT superfamily N-acetyltransferase
MSSSITVRAAWPGDLGVIRMLDADARGPAKSQAMSKQIAQGMSWIGEIDGVAAAYAIVTPSFFARPFVERIFVAEPFRRRGIATAILERCESAYHSNEVYISANASNGAMRAVLAKIEYQDSGVILGLDDRDPELVYVKRRAPNLTFVKFRAQA